MTSLKTPEIISDIHVAGLFNRSACSPLIEIALHETLQHMSPGAPLPLTIGLRNIADGRPSHEWTRPERFRYNSGGSRLPGVRRLHSPVFAYVQLAVGDTTFTNSSDTCNILHNCDPIDGTIQHTARLKPSANTSDLGQRALKSEYTYHPDNRKAGLAKLALLLIDPSDFIELHGLGTTVSWPEKEVWNASRNQTGTVRQIGMTSGYFSSQGSVSYIHNFAIRIAKQYHNPWDTMAGIQANTYNNGLWEIPPVSPAGLLGLGEEDGHMLSGMLAERIFNTRRKRHEAALEVLELAAQRKPAQILEIA